MLTGRGMPADSGTGWGVTRLHSEESNEFLGKTQVQRVLAVPAGVGAVGTNGEGIGVGARVGGRHGALLSGPRWITFLGKLMRWALFDSVAKFRYGGKFGFGRGSEMKGVGNGDVDGLGIHRSDQFVQAVQPGQQVGLAAQDR